MIRKKKESAPKNRVGQQSATAKSKPRPRRRQEGQGNMGAGGRLVPKKEEAERGATRISRFHWRPRN